MNRPGIGKDLNEPKIEKDIYNRAQQIILLITEAQILIQRGDMFGELGWMYQGCQSILDCISSDFIERVKETDGKTHVYRGMRTRKFIEYRKLLDQANNLANLSQSNEIDREDRGTFKNNSYRKLQKLKYSLYLELDKLGYNAKLHNRSDSYREGNK